MTHDTHGDLDAILASGDALLGEDESLTPTRSVSGDPLLAGQLIAAWSERAGQLAARAQRLGDCRAGEVAAAEAGAWRDAAYELARIVRLP